MKWRTAVARVWGLPVVWEARMPEPAEVTATATVVHVHYYVPAPGIGPALPQPREAITEGSS